MHKALEPERISLARRRRGLTMVALARALGVSDRTVQKYEKGEAPLSMAPQLSHALGYPQEYFMRPLGVEVETQNINYRAGRATTRSARDAAEASGVSGIEVYRWVEDYFDLPETCLPSLPRETPEMAAQMVRDRWGLGIKPLPNLVQLCESKGIRVMALPLLAQSVDAFSLFAGAQPYIFLARHKTPERTRFDVAHELGHLVMHRNSAEFSTAEQEKQADRFASSFLMPEELLAMHLPRNATFEQILDAKYALKVSAHALTVTLHKTGRMSDWAYRTTTQKISQLGYRRGEPQGMPSYEHSRVFQQVIGADKKGTVTIDRIAGDLSLPPDDVHTLMFGTGLRAVATEPYEFGRDTTASREPRSPAEPPSLRVL